MTSHYLSAGANRQTAAADWATDGTLCYGAGRNLAVWRPADENGVRQLLRGHQDEIKAVQFLRSEEETQTSLFVSGGDDKSLMLWAIGKDDKQKDSKDEPLQIVADAHSAPINCIAAARQSVGNSSSRTLFATGAADYTIKIWALEQTSLVLLQTIRTTPRFFPLCLALVALPSSTGEEKASSWLLAAAGTNNRIQIFTGIETASREAESTTQTTKSGAVTFEVQATLKGHEDWIRSLDFGWESKSFSSSSDLLLASASQDKYVRLWRIHRGSSAPAPTASATAAAAAIGEADTTLDLSSTTATSTTTGNAPSNKAHRLQAGEDVYFVTFEALLLGHEDWIYSARWTSVGASNKGHKLRLLTTSADNSLGVWEADAASGIWVTTARLGELSKEKGATTATGSIGGFWAGLWSPDGREVVTLCRTGSWRRWTTAVMSAVAEASAEDTKTRENSNEETNEAPAEDTETRWVQALGVTGHVAPVTGVSWSRDGAYLLSTSTDQTTRLHAEWTQRSLSEASADASQVSSPSWHEMARPQIHGYDLNCIDSLGTTQFVSGADEKLMRVFHEPKSVARLLQTLTGRGVSSSEGEALPDAANMPVLGLSNKAVDEEGDATESAPTEVDASFAGIARPPPEDVLARNTLWPETEKLYGHGYEISCLAVSHDGSLVASACRASSLNHAVVRLFATAPHWTEVRPPLPLHTLTVTRLRFSGDDRYLLSVGRDRQWAVFARSTDTEKSTTYTLAQHNAKAHSRMILDCAWAPTVNGRRVFATAGRDKTVKVWLSTVTDGNENAAPSFALTATVTQDEPVTAVDFLWRAASSSASTTTPQLVLAVGTEAGRLTILTLDAATLAETGRQEIGSGGALLSGSVLQLAWRPQQTASEQDGDAHADLAIAGEDGSLRVYRYET
ncbi:Elongator subunit elp2 [Sporothrix bragantina]|uniref:Elongator complex protein 2 n=1 Tax=Sporothrix bragantina TaxID=671064 RepID=A0ABP0AUH4_9PEZI